jgi:hypothetical protein
MKTETYTGKVSGMKTSPWLASEDLLGISPQQVVIAGVYKHEDIPMDGGRKEKLLFAIGFEKIQKQLILNATNRKALSRQFGADTKQWIGKTVTLFVQDGVRKPGGRTGETCTGLRIASGESKPMPSAADIMEELNEN